MRVILKKGDNPVVRLPAAIVRAAHFHINQPLEVRVEQGRVIIEPAPEEIDIEALCAALDVAEKPELIEFGLPVGSEVW